MSSEGNIATVFWMFVHKTLQLAAAIPFLIECFNVTMGTCAQFRRKKPERAQTFTGSAKIAKEINQMCLCDIDTQNVAF